MRKILVLLSVMSLGAIGASSQTTPKESLLVLSKHDQTLAIVDPATLKVVAKMPVGADPHEVIATADGKTAYVSNYGGGGAGALHTLAVLDLVNQKALASIDLGALKGPHGLDFAGGKVWFTAEAAKAFGSVDPASEKVDFILGSGQNRTHMIYVTRDLTRIYTTNIQSGTLSIWEKVRPALPSGPPPAPGAPPPGQFPAEWSQSLVEVGAGSEGFDVTPDGKEIWTADSQDGTIAVVSVAEIGAEDRSERARGESAEVRTGWKTGVRFEFIWRGCSGVRCGFAERSKADSRGARRGGNRDAARWSTRVCCVHAGQLCSRD